MGLPTLVYPYVDARNFETKISFEAVSGPVISGVILSVNSLTPESDNPPFDSAVSFNPPPLYLIADDTPCVFLTGSILPPELDIGVTYYALDHIFYSGGYYIMNLASTLGGPKITFSDPSVGGASLDIGGSGSSEVVCYEITVDDGTAISITTNVTMRTTDGLHFAQFSISDVFNNTGGVCTGKNQADTVVNRDNEENYFRYNIVTELGITKVQIVASSGLDSLEAHWSGQIKTVLVF
jgi:hypothetical protein